MERAPAIPVLLSRRALAIEAPAVEAPFVDAGTTYSMAQETRWVDPDTFAIGRWDGTLTLFGMPRAPKQGPRIESADVSPAWAGLEMITPVSPSVFATSNAEDSIVTWDLSRMGLAEPERVLPYHAAVGVANSGATVTAEGRDWLVTGHANGQLVIWRAGSSPHDFTAQATVDIRSPAPIDSPYRLWNVRSVEAWGGGAVVTGAEDGDLCVVEIPSGRVRSRRRYNPDAQRGINSIAVAGDTLLVANCSVGRDDSNAWLYRIEPPGEIAPLAHVNLVHDATRAQVFNFSVELVEAGGRLLYLCATEEGLLWVGEVAADLRVLGSTHVSSGLGAAISAQPASRGRRRRRRQRPPVPACTRGRLGRRRAAAAGAADHHVGHDGLRAETAERVGVLGGRHVVVHPDRLAVPADPARAAVAVVERRVREQPAAGVALDVDPEAVERIADERRARRRGRQHAGREGVAVVQAGAVGMTAAAVQHLLRDRVAPVRVQRPEEQ